MLTRSRLRLWLLFSALLYLCSGCQWSFLPSVVPSSPVSPDLVAAHILPDRTKTPGAVRAPLPLSELCRTGHSTQVRHELTSTQWARLKSQVYASYGITHHQRGDYEVDHLIPLELNGSNSPLNLFPQTQRTLWSAAVKDHLENVLHQKVCRGELSLQAADTAIAQNWWDAYNVMWGLNHKP